MALKGREVGDVVVEPEDAFATTEVDGATFSFMWEIVNFPEVRENLLSPVFKGLFKEQGQHAWSLEIRPQSKNVVLTDLHIQDESEDKKVDEEMYYGFFLFCETLSDAEKEDAYFDGVKADFQINLVDSDRKVLKTEKAPQVRAFFKKPAAWGWTNFILRSEVLNMANGFLSQGHVLRVHCEIFMCGGIKHGAVGAKPPVLRNSAQENPNPNLVSEPNSVSVSVAASDSASSLISDSNDKFDLSALQKKMMDFLAVGKFSDVTLESEKESFPCYKFVLAAFSPVFEAMFDSGMSESSGSIVKIEDFSSVAVGGMIQFLFTGKTKLLEENAKELFSIADKYQIAGLKNKCEETLLKNLRVENALEMLIWAHFQSPQILKPQIIYFVNRFKKQIVNTDGFKSMVKEYPIICAELYTSLA